MLIELAKGFTFCRNENGVSMKILIFDGNRFIGRAVTQAALNAGHEVTLFNQDINPKLFPITETLNGDRDGDLAILQGRTWDVVFDPSGYHPRTVRNSARVLAGSVDQYIFISSISSYADFSQVGIDENSPQAVLADPSIDEVNDETYGPFKALCERALEEEINGRVLHIRPALVVGSHDANDLFPYWVHRVAQGGNVLVPGTADTPMQFIDVHDLAAWIIQVAEQRLTGPYIATGPDYQLTMGKILQTIKNVSQSDATFTYVGDAFLRDKGLKSNTETPWWIPVSEKGYGQFNNQKAIHAGLTFRPLAETVADTLTWLDSRPADYAWGSGLSPEFEAQLLKEWCS